MGFYPLGGSNLIGYRGPVGGVNQRGGIRKKKKKQGSTHGLRVGWEERRGPGSEEESASKERIWEYERVG